MTLLSVGGESFTHPARHMLTLNTPRRMVGACQADEKIPTGPDEPSLEKREAAGSVQLAGLLCRGNPVQASALGTGRHW